VSFRGRVLKKDNLMETYFFGRFVFKLCPVTEMEKTYATYLECFVVESLIRVSTLSFEGL